ncbi:MAG: hypothetical protein GF372_11965 [Candidatus Marinimicrobia bacterium]|nr:hypothetical protein [Candidatus Neomarinimicrobiota bacterium]
MKKVWILIAGLLLVNCAGPKESAQVNLNWVTNPQAEYPHAMYLTGVGISEDLSAAKKHAKAEIASQIQTTIKSNITDIERETSRRGEITSESDFRQRIDEITEVSISGVIYPKIEEKDGRYYVLGVLDKMQYLQDMRSQLDEMASAISDLHTSLHSEIAGGGLLTALDNYRDMSEIMEEFVSVRSIYNAVSNGPYPQRFDFTLAAIETELVSIARTAEISVQSGENQNGTVGKYLPQPVEVKTTYAHDGTTFPAAGFYIQFQNSDGSLITKVEANDQGTARARIIAVPGQVTGQGQVTVSFASMPYGILNKNLRNREVVIPYSLHQPKYDFTLQLVDGNLDANEQFKSSIESELTKMGYALRNDSPARLQVRLGIATSQSVSGFAGSQYMAEARATVKLIESTSGAVLGQTEFIGKGLHKDSRDAAESMAFKNIRIERNKLIQLIAGAESRLADIYAN